MTVHERVVGDVTILEVDGRMTVDAQGDVRLRIEVRRLLQQGRKRFVLHLERVPQMDSSGLCDLVTAHTAAMRRDGWLKLLHLSPRVRDLLAVTKLLTVLEVFDSEADAVASFGPASSI